MMSTRTYDDLLAIFEAAEPIIRNVDTTSDLNEADDDPHRLARINLERYATNHDGRTIRYWRDEWYVWKDRRYRRISERELRAKLTGAVREEFERLAQSSEPNRDGEVPQVQKINLGLISNVIQATSSMVCLPSSMELGTWIPDRTPRKYVSMKNGILDIPAAMAERSDYLQSNTPNWFSQVSLPYDFDPDASCPLFNSFLEHNQEMDPERIKVLQEWAGYLLLPATEEQKFMILEGEGANGKSVFIAALTAMLGIENVAAVPLEKFGDRFSLTTTLGKLLNAAGDCGDLDKAAEGDLKSFTGGNRMYFDRKGIPGIECYPTARLMIACNNRPRFADKSQGIWRRMLLIPWRVEITRTTRVKGMDKVDWWNDSGELPGIFNWALEGLQRLRAQRDFTESSLMQEALQDYQAEVNPARSFLDEACERSQFGGKIFCRELYGAYEKWCKANGHSYPLSERQFGKEVKRKFTTSVRDRETTGRRSWYYDGISYLNEFIAEDQLP